MNNAERGAGGEEEKKNIIAELLKIVIKTLLRENSAKLTRLVYDQEGGAVGKKVAGLRNKLNEIESKKGGDDVDELKTAYRELIDDFAKMFVEQKEEIDDFRKKREVAVERQGEDRATNSIGGDEGLEALSLEYQERAGDEQKREYDKINREVSANRVSRSRRGIEKDVRDNDTEAIERKVRGHASYLKSEKEVVELDREMDDEMRRLQLRAVKLKREIKEKLEGRGEGAEVERIESEMERGRQGDEVESLRGALPNVSEAGGDRAEKLIRALKTFDKVPPEQRITKKDLLEKMAAEVNSAYVDGEISEEDHQLLTEMLGTREVWAVQGQMYEGATTERQRVERRRELEAEQLLRVVRGEQTATQAFENIDRAAQAEMIGPTEWQRHLDRVAGVDELGRPTGILDPALRSLRGADEFMGYTPDQLYRMAKKEIRDKYAKDLTEEERERFVFTKEMYVEFIWDTINQIAGSGRQTYDEVNRTLASMVSQLLKHERVLGDFGISEAVRREVESIYMAFTSTHDLYEAYWSIGSLERLAEAGHRLPHDHLAELMLKAREFEVKYKVNEAEEVRRGKVKMGVGMMRSLYEQKYWSDKMLSLNAEEREKFGDQMLLYLMARQLDGFVDVDWSKGSPEFGKLKFVYKRENGQDVGVVLGIKDAAGNYFDLQGLVGGADLNGNGRLAADNLLRKMRWVVAYADGMFHHTGRAAYHDVEFKGRVADWHVKYMTKRYEEMYGIALFPELIEALDHGYRDYESVLVGKLLKSELNSLELNGRRVTDDEAKEIGDLLDFMLIDREGWLMSREVMLKNFDELFIYREITDTGGKKTSRFRHLSVTQRRRAEALAKKYLENENLNWSSLIGYFGQDSLHQGAVGNVKGINGFKEVIKRFNMQTLYRNRDFWEQRTQKYYGYLKGAEETKKLAMKFYANPTWENLVEVVEAGYPWMDRNQKMQKALDIWDKMSEINRRRLVVERYKQGKVREKVIDKKVSKFGEGRDEMGRLVYETEVAGYVDTIGSVMRWPKKRDMYVERELDQLYKRNWIDEEDYQYRRARELEWNPGTWFGGGKEGASRTFRKLWTGDVGFIINDLDVVKNTPWLKAFTRKFLNKGWMQWGPGSWIRRLRVWSSRVTWGEVVAGSGEDALKLLLQAAAEGAGAAR